MLANSLADVDVILGGHDHLVFGETINGRPTVISGTDFRQVGVVDLELGEADAGRNGRRPVLSSSFSHTDVTSQMGSDAATASLLKEIQEGANDKLGKIVGWCATEIDATALSCRTGESNFGSWVADLTRIALGADVCIINGGTFRSDSRYLPGKVTLGRIIEILPFSDPMVVIRVTGKQLRGALEASASALPALDGRFGQVGFLPQFQFFRFF